MSVFRSGLWVWESIASDGLEVANGTGSWGTQNQQGIWYRRTPRGDRVITKPNRSEQAKMVKQVSPLDIGSQRKMYTAFVGNVRKSVPKSALWDIFESYGAGIALGELKSIGDLYDFNSIATLFVIGAVSVTPTLMSKTKAS